MIRQTTILLLLFALHTLWAEDTYFISFTDKGDFKTALESPERFLSKRALERRERQNIELDSTDAPVIQEYIDAVKAIGVDILYVTKWNNGAVAVISPQDTASVHGLSMVKDIELIKKTRTRAVVAAGQSSKFDSPEIESRGYGMAENQVEMLGANVLHDAGYTGKGIIIAVLDAGFRGVDHILPFSSLNQNKQIISTWHYSKRDSNVYVESDHGTGVLSVMAAKDGTTPFGIAPDADYMLAVTEDSDGEFRIEEYNWLIAAERADSAGVDIINSSLVYYNFDLPEHNYEKSELDGNTAVITNAADQAAQKGILVVCCAGNNGNNSWGTIAPPADADSVLTVGAVDANENVVSFSSPGPTADGRIKPDISAQGKSTYVVSYNGIIKTSSGTSLSSPLIASFAACLWQANPKLTNMEMIELIKGMSSNSSSPDNKTGYGIPFYEGAVVANEEVRIVNSRSDLRFFVAEKNIVLNRNADRIRVFDLKGKLMKELVNSSTIDLNDLSSNMFILEAYVDNQLSLKKIGLH